MPAAQGQGNQTPERGNQIAARGRKPENVWQPWPLLTQAQIEESPSFKQGMSFKDERKLREAACKIISLAGLASLTCIHPLYELCKEPSQHADTVKA